MIFWDLHSWNLCWPSVVRIFAISPLLDWHYLVRYTAVICWNFSLDFILFQHEVLIIGLFLMPFFLFVGISEYFYVVFDAHSQAYVLWSPVLAIFCKLSIWFSLFVLLYRTICCYCCCFVLGNILMITATVINLVNWMLCTSSMKLGVRSC